MVAASPFRSNQWVLDGLLRGARDGVVWDFCVGARPGGLGSPSMHVLAGGAAAVASNATRVYDCVRDALPENVRQGAAWRRLRSRMAFITEYICFSGDSPALVVASRERLTFRASAARHAATVRDVICPPNFHGPRELPFVSAPFLERRRFPLHESEIAFRYRGGAGDDGSHWASLRRYGGVGSSGQFHSVAVFAAVPADDEGLIRDGNAPAMHDLFDAASGVVRAAAFQVVRVLAPRRRREHGVRVSECLVEEAYVSLDHASGDELRIGFHAGSLSGWLQMNAQAADLLMERLIQRARPDR